jgi:hypothetical protein
MTAPPRITVVVGEAVAEPVGPVIAGVVVAGGSPAETGGTVAVGSLGATGVAGPDGGTGVVGWVDVAVGWVPGVG